MPRDNNRESIPERCPDGGTCHHACPGETYTSAGDPVPGQPCFRVLTCGPLSGVFPDDRWPDAVKQENRLAAGQCPHHGNACTPDTVPTLPAAPSEPEAPKRPADPNQFRLFNVITVREVGGGVMFEHGPDAQVLVEADLMSARSPEVLDILVQRLGELPQGVERVMFSAEVHQPSLVRFGAAESRWRGFIHKDETTWVPVRITLSHS